MAHEERLLAAWSQAEEERREYAVRFFPQGDAPSQAVLDIAAIKKFAKLDRRAKAAREQWYAHLKRPDE